MRSALRLAQLSSASLGLTDYSQFDMLSSRYTSVNFRGGKSPDSPNGDSRERVSCGSHPGENIRANGTSQKWTPP